MDVPNLQPCDQESDALKKYRFSCMQSTDCILLGLKQEQSIEFEMRVIIQQTTNY